MKAIPLNLTPRRKEVLWHAAYNETDWSADAYHPYGYKPVPKVRLGQTDVTVIVNFLRNRRLIRFDVVEVRHRRWQIFIRITPLGMDVLLGNVACVDPKRVAR